MRWWTVREWEGQWEKEKLDSLASLYHTTGLSNRGGYRPLSLVSQFSSQSLWVYSRLRESRPHTRHALTVIRVHTYARSRTSARISIGDLCFRYASQLERRGGWWGTKTDGGRQTSLLYLLSPILRTKGERGRCGEWGEPAEPVWRTSTGFIKPRL